MTVIENIQRQRSISAGQTAPYASAESFGAGYADSLNRIGNSLLEKQKQRDELADLEAEAETKRALSDSRIELMKRQQELQLNHTGDAKGFADRFNNEARKFLEAGRSSLSNAKSAYMFNDAMEGMLTSFFDSNLDFENRELRSQAVAGTEIAINNEVAIARNGGAVDDSIKRAYEHIDFLDKTGASSGDVIKLRNNTRQELMLANLKYTVDKDPSKALSVIGRGTLGLETLPLGELRARLEQVESGGDPKARSQKGAKGLRQIMPNTAREVAGKLGLNEIAGMTDAELEVALENPELNRQLGDFYLNELLQNYDGDQVLATAAYNAGPGNVNNWLKTVGDPRTGKISHQEFIDNIPFGETKRYVGKILGNQTGVGHASFSGLTGGYKDEAERYSEKQYRDWQIKERIQNQETYQSALVAIREGKQEHELSPEQQRVTSSEFWHSVSDFPQEQLREIEVAKKVGGFNRKIHNMDNVQIKDELNNYEKLMDSQSPAYISQIIIYDALKQTAKTIIEFRAKDPTGYIFENNKELGDTFAAALQNGDPVAYRQVMSTANAYAESIGIEQLPPMPKEIAMNMVHNLNKSVAENKPAEIAATFEQLKSTMGKDDFMRAINQVVENGGHPVLFSAVVFNRLEDSASLQLALNTATNQKEIEKRLGGDQVKNLRDSISTNSTHNNFIDGLLDEESKMLMSENHYLIALGMMSMGKTESEAIEGANKAVWARFDTDAIEDFGVFVEKENHNYDAASVNKGLGIIQQNINVMNSDFVGTYIQIPENLAPSARDQLIEYRKSLILERTKMTTGPNGDSVQFYWTLDTGLRQPLVKNGKPITIPFSVIDLASNIQNKNMKNATPAAIEKIGTSLKDYRGITQSDFVRVQNEKSDRISQQLANIIFNHEWGQDPEADNKAIIRMYMVR